MFEANRVDTSGIFYRKFGAGPAIFLLHGFPAAGDLWRNIWEDLSVLYTVIVPDLPGSGKSPLNGEPGISDMAAMIKEIADKEGFNKVLLAGHSMGGYVALACASLYPAHVAGLSLVHSTTDADDEEKIKTRKKAIALIEKGGKKGFIDQMVPNLFSPATKQGHPELVEKQIHESMQISDEAMINFYKAMIARADTNKVLESASFPVQWICGLDDNVIPCNKISGKTHMSTVNFVSSYENCGHMSMLETQQQLISDLKEFASYCYRSL